MRFAQRLLAGLTCIAACHAALADRSRVGEDSDVIDAGDCELEVAAERVKARDTARERKSALQLNCGIGWRTELAAAFATTRSDSLRVRSAEVEAKTALRDRSGGRIGWTLVYGVVADRDPGRVWRRHGQFVAVEASRQVGAD